MYASFSPTDRPSLPHRTRSTPTGPTTPLLILGDPSPLIDTLQVQLEHAFPHSPLLRTAWMGDALDRMATHPADAVFLSATLLDGRVFSCARTIKARWPQTRTILVAERRLTLSELPQAEALDACLVAPITQVQVRQLMEAVLAWSRLYARFSYSVFQDVSSGAAHGLRV